MASFLVDECVDRFIVQALAEAGHEMTAIPEAQLSSTDASIAALAQSLGKIVLTQDYDFGELAVRHNVLVPGVVLLACQILPVRERVSRVVEAIGLNETGLLATLTIIEPNRIRRRPLPSN